MCGFAAFFCPGRLISENILRQADLDLFHRGPDSGNIQSDVGWGLVFRRLSILDVRHEADQPMTSQEGQVTLVYNGEIYNYKTLRTELEAAGAIFRTTGDTEVLLQGYLKWGENVVDHLEGMFAFVLIDRRKNLAMAARDPFGIKPLYLRRVGDTLGFASEIRPLLRLGPAQPDPAALAELLEFSWAGGERSNVKGVERVKPGTLITIPLDGGETKSRQFFDILDTLQSDPTISLNKALAQSEEALVKSLEDHLASDVGYTVQLSGGVDSSLLTALAEGRTAGRLATFSVDLGDYKHNEKIWRDQVIAGRNLDHHEILLDSKSFADALPRAVHHMEGPVPHGGCVMLMLLCDQIRKTSKVVLTGEGADEMFGGYERYGLWQKLAWQEKLGHFFPPSLLPPIWPFKGIRKLGGKDVAALASVYTNTAWLGEVFSGLSSDGNARQTASQRFEDFRDRLLAVDQTVYLSSLLARQDKMAMAASVEARVPFVHLPLLKAVNRLPHSLRIPGKVTKPLLKKIAERYLPHDVLHRRKVGLLLPFDEWCRDEKSLGRYLELLTEPSSHLAQHGDRKMLSKAVNGFRNGSTIHQQNMFKLINTELWLRDLEGTQKALMPLSA